MPDKAQIECPLQAQSRKITDGIRRIFRSDGKSKIRLLRQAYIRPRRHATVCLYLIDLAHSPLCGTRR